jgi:hypothetical protein
MRDYHVFPAYIGNSIEGARVGIGKDSDWMSIGYHHQKGGI